MLVLQNPYLLCICGHVKHMEILLFGTHSLNWLQFMNFMSDFDIGFNNIWSL